MQQPRSAEKAARFSHLPKVNYTIDEAAYVANLGRSTLYEAILSGELETLKVGKRRLVPVEALKAWLTSKRAA